MADNSPIFIGRDNLANPGAQTLLSRDETSTHTDPVFTVRTLVGGDGIHGEASGDRTGVQGTSTGAGGVGVRGSSTNANGFAGVHGESTSSIGVSGRTSSGQAGVRGISSKAVTAVLGHAMGDGSNSGIGVRGISKSSTGVLGEITSADAPHSIGVSGRNTGSGTGVSGSSSGGTGVFGRSSGGTGVRGEGLGGLAPNSSTGVSGTSSGGIGVSGSGTNGGFGVSGRAASNSGKAGHFDGGITIVNGLKPFTIDHPLDPQNKYLVHTSVESPEMKNVYDGVARLDEEGAAWVELPEWFEALNGDFRYQLTAVGGSAPGLHVAEEVSENRFKIAGGEGGMKVCWQLTGSRKDPWAAANPFEVEQEKREEERGRYLDPGLYDAPEEQRVMIGPIPPEAVEEEQRPPQPSGIDPARLEEEHRRQLDELGRLEEEQRREMEELRRRREQQEEEPPEEST